MALLSIVIPAFNEERHIARSVESVLVQVTGEIAAKVELLVIDNASTDDTGVLSRALMAGRGTYLRNESNIGFAGSVHRAIRECVGEYVWILGAQEQILPRGIETLLSLLEAERPMGVRLSCQIYDEANSSTTMPAPLRVSGGSWRTGRDFLRGGGPAVAVSSNVFRRSLLTSGLDDAVKTPEWAHVEICVNGILRNLDAGPYLPMPIPVFVLYQNQDGWWTTEQVFLLFLRYLELMKLLYREEPSLWRATWRRQGGMAFWRSIVLGRRNNLVLSLSIVRRILWLAPGSSRTYLVSLPLMLIPLAAANGFLTLAETVKGRLVSIKSGLRRHSIGMLSRG